MNSLFHSISSLDLNIAEWIVAWRTANLDNFFYVVTALGHWLGITITFIVIALILKHYKKASLIKYFFLAILGSGLLTLFIKSVTGRARPIGDIPLYVEKLSSFPSAHAALIFGLFGFLIYCFCRFRISTCLKTLSIIIFILIILAVGFSRLYLGVHFFTDVLGGYLVGLLWVLVAMHLSRSSFR